MFSNPPANVKASMMARMTVSSDIQVDFIPSARPAMMTVAGPVSALSATSRVGLKSYPVKYSAAFPIAIPASIPVTIASQMPHQLTSGMSPRRT